MLRSFDFLAKNTFELFGFQICWHWAYVMEIEIESSSPALNLILRFYLWPQQLFELSLIIYILLHRCVIVWKYKVDSRHRIREMSKQFKWRMKWKIKNILAEQFESLIQKLQTQRQNRYPYIYLTFHLPSWPGTGTSIKSGVVKLVLLNNV